MAAMARNGERKRRHVLRARATVRQDWTRPWAEYALFDGANAAERQPRGAVSENGRRTGASKFV